MATLIPLQLPLSALLLARLSEFTGAGITKGGIEDQCVLTVLTVSTH